MNPYVRNTLIGISPIASAVANAAPGPDITKVNPPDGSVVTRQDVILRGKIIHDSLPDQAITATLNGKPLRIMKDGNFEQPVRLKPGANELKLRASVANPRQQVTRISAYIDGSMVYGSDTARANALRTFEGGRLKTSGDNLLPLNTDGFANANDSGIFPDEELFLAGDVRANENLELTAIHTLFLREHNQLAAAIQKGHPGMDDEAIYQKARSLVIAEIQAITYREFLPALLGQGALRPYRGYQPGVNAGIATEFSTAAFRIGHTLINDDVEFLDNNGEEIADGLPLAYAFFNPLPIKALGPDSVLKYLATDNAQEVDTQLVDGLRNFLFGPPGAGGLDLAAMNLQRGRDHGIPGYNEMRRAYGMPRADFFSQVTTDAKLQESLTSLYGSPDKMDAWIGGLAEDHLPGSSVGPTFRRIIADQFERTRDGDANWFERSFGGSQLETLRRTRLSDIIRRNTTITKLQDNVFFFDSETTLAGLVERPGFLPKELVGGMNFASTPASYDGTGNNRLHPNWGSAGSDLLRLAKPDYGDGISSPSGADRPNARAISNAVSTLTTDFFNDRFMSSWVYGWGQFIDHDLSLTTTGDTSFNIQVPNGDVSFDPYSSGTVVIPLNRSDYNPDTGTAESATAVTVHHLTFKPLKTKRR